jgi:hypothetical protein
MPHPTVHAISVKASLYLLSQKRTLALPNTSVEEITAEIINSKSIIIGAKNSEFAFLKLGVYKLKKVAIDTI